MSEYRRLVSYIYLYDKGIKVKNSGFAKIECKDNSLRIKINLKGVFNNNYDNWKVYLLIEVNKEMQGIYAGDLKCKGNSAEFQLNGLVNNINGTTKSFDDLNGLTVISAGNKKYATFWKDSDVSLDNFREYEEKEEKTISTKINTSLGKIFSINNSKEKDELLKAMSVENKEDEKKIQSDKEMKTDINSEKIKDQSLEKEEIQQGENVKEQNISNKTIQEQNLNNKNLQENKLSENWDKLIAQYKKINPFSDDEIECIRIELKDLRILPKSQWLLSNNSFVLHGYYNYKYLIVGKINNNFILGVPGIFCNKEKLVAGIFGFNDFKPAQVSEYKTGRFGYWYKNL